MKVVGALFFLNSVLLFPPGISGLAGDDLDVSIRKKNPTTQKVTFCRAFPARLETGGRERSGLVWCSADGAVGFHS